MIALGIDFGTSNCSACLARGGGPVSPIPLEGDDPFLPSVLFTARSEIAVEQVAQTEFWRRMKEARAEQSRVRQAGGTPMSDEVLEKSIENAMRREAAEEAERKYWDQTFFSSLRDGQAVIFGTPALRAYFQDPLSGTLIRSPKSFLGADLGDEHMTTFTVAVANVLAHIKRKAQTLAGAEIARVVLGRPVNYQGVSGSEGNARAIDIMRTAASNAGFSEVEFFLEPVAAALEFERRISRETIVLVVDVGGGTTDCAMVRLGPRRRTNPDRAADVLGYAGGRVGGTDFDQSLAWDVLMPLFGKDTRMRSGLPIPHGPLIDAISTRDVPAQIRFRRAARDLAALVRDAQRPDLLSRLVLLHREQLQYRLIHSAELAKIALSQARRCAIELDYLEDGLRAEVSDEDFLDAGAQWLDRIGAYAAAAVESSGARPDLVFLTGGMATSPAVQARLRELLGDSVEIRSGDMLGSVGKGLGVVAARVHHCNGRPLSRAPLPPGG